MKNCICILLCGYIFLFIECEITELNTVALQGSDVILPCNPPSSQETILIIWKVFQPGDKDGRIIFDSRDPEVIEDGYQLVPGSTSDLSIQNADPEHSGTYQCSLFGTLMDTINIHLSILEKLSCDPQPPNNNRRNGGNTAYTCSIRISGVFHPQLSWYNAGVLETTSFVVQHYDELNPTPEWPLYRTHSIRLEKITSPAMDHMPFECRLSFNDTNTGVTYNDICHSHISVNYHPRDTSFTINQTPIVSSQSNPYRVRVNDAINCTTQSNPAAKFYFQKVEGPGPYAIQFPPHPYHNVAQLIITEDMLDANDPDVITTYKCVAKNTIRGHEEQSEGGISFVADSASMGSRTSNRSAKIKGNTFSFFILLLLTTTYKCATSFL